MWVDVFDPTNIMAEPWEVLRDLLRCLEIQDIFEEWMNRTFTAIDVLTTAEDLEYYGGRTADCYDMKFIHQVMCNRSFMGVSAPVEGEDYAYGGCYYSWIDA